MARKKSTFEEPVSRTPAKHAPVNAAPIAPVVPEKVAPHVEPKPTSAAKPVPVAKPAPSAVAPPVAPPAPVLPTAEALAHDIGQQLLARASARQNNGVRVYDAQGNVILTHSLDFVRMCLTTDDPAYKAMVKDAARVEVFAR